MIEFYEKIERKEQEKVNYLSTPISWEYKLVSGIVLNQRITTKQLPHLIKVMRNYPFNSSDRAKVDANLANRDYGFHVEASVVYKSHVTVCDYNKLMFEGRTDFKVREQLKSAGAYKLCEEELCCIVSPTTYEVLLAALAHQTITYDDEVLEVLANFTESSKPSFGFELDTGNLPFVHIFLEEAGIL